MCVVFNPARLEVFVLRIQLLNISFRKVSKSVSLISELEPYLGSATSHRLVTRLERMKHRDGQREHISWKNSLQLRGFKKEAKPPFLCGSI